MGEAEHRVNYYTFLFSLTQQRGNKPHFAPEGLLQVDPLSPYLFLICAEALSTAIQKARVSNQVSGSAITLSCPTISHLFFANDSLIFCKAMISELYAIKMMLLDYEKVPGQKINFEKFAL